jgi:hypothetical protein
MAIRCLAIRSATLHSQWQLQHAEHGTFLGSRLAPWPEPPLSYKVTQPTLAPGPQKRWFILDTSETHSLLRLSHRVATCVAHNPKWFNNMVVQGATSPMR